MNSLKEVYLGVVQHDHEKVAAARAAQGLPPDLSQVDPALLKQAQDYDMTGRILAHHVMYDLIKEALDEAGVADDKKDDMLADAMAAARGEKKDDKKDKDKKDEAKSDDDKKDEESEKQAAAKRAILQKMAKDPAYVSQLVAKHQQKKPKAAAKPRMAR